MMKWINKNKVLLLVVFILLVLIDITIRIMFKFSLVPDISPNITPLLGVIVGASLGYVGTIIQTLISNKSEKTKRKERIKYELFATYHQYYQYVKAQKSTSTQAAFYARRYDLFRLHKVDAEAISINRKLYEIENSKFNDVFHKLHKIESDLVAIQIEIIELFKNEIDIDVFNELMKAIILDGNKAELLLEEDLNTIYTVEEIDKIGLKLGMAISTGDSRLFQKGEETKNKLIELFK